MPSIAEVALLVSIPLGFLTLIIIILSVERMDSDDE